MHTTSTGFQNQTINSNMLGIFGDYFSSLKVGSMIFVPCDKNRGWLALLSTDITIADGEIIRLYSKRWDIEVFF